MSKEEHRKLFELQVKAEDTLKKQAELEQQQQIELVSGTESIETNICS